MERARRPDRNDAVNEVRTCMHAGDNTTARELLCTVLNSGLCQDTITLFRDLYPLILLEDCGDHYTFHNLRLNIPGRMAADTPGILHNKPRLAQLLYPQPPPTYTAKLLKRRLGAQNDEENGLQLAAHTWSERARTGEFGEYTPGAAPLHNSAAIALCHAQYHPVPSQRRLAKEVCTFLGPRNYQRTFLATTTRVQYADAGTLDKAMHEWAHDDTSTFHAPIKGPSCSIDATSVASEATYALLGERSGELTQRAWKHMNARTPELARLQTPRNGDERTVIIGSDAFRKFYIDASAAKDRAHALGWSVQPAPR